MKDSRLVSVAGRGASANPENRKPKEIRIPKTEVRIASARGGGRRGLAALLAALLIFTCSAFAEQVPIARVEQMPNLPAPYQMRDWQKVTRDYVDLVFDENRRGEFLPLLTWKDSARKDLMLPSYVGRGNSPEAINYLAAVVSGGLVGIDMRSHRGRDWVAQCTNWFGAAHGLVGNNVRGGSGGSFWYDLFPNVLFFQVCDLNPGDAARDQMLKRIAESGYDVCVALGAGPNGALPNFDHTAYNFQRRAPVDNGKRIEPEAMAAIAWCEYLAWTKFKDPRFLQAADWCLQAMQQRPAERNPLYEVLLPFGAMAAGRMNAELGRAYDVPKLLRWCFEPMDKPAARPWWGVLAERFGEYDCHGLVGSSKDTGGYAFAMNTFDWAGALAPLARYDSRYARALGKWLLNLANASRLFYPNALPAAQQDHLDWAQKNDPNFCLAYEGVRKWSRRYDLVARDVQTLRGRVKQGSWQSTADLDRACEVLETATAGGRAQLEHIWELPVSPGNEHVVSCEGHFVSSNDRDRGAQFQYSSKPAGPWLPLFTVGKGEAKFYGKALTNLSERLYVRAYVDQPAGSGASPAALYVDYLRLRVENNAVSPYATGDARTRHTTSLNLCLYGASHVGNLGGLVRATSEEKILQLDLLRTDYFHGAAYPTFLFYNPYPAAKSFAANFGDKTCDLYDAVSGQILKRGVAGKDTLTLASDSAAVVVVLPAGTPLTRQGTRTLAGDTVVNWR